MSTIVEVYKAERHVRYRKHPRWNWRLFIDGERLCNGPGYDAEQQALSAASRLAAALKQETKVSVRYARPR